MATDEKVESYTLKPETREKIRSLLAETVAYAEAEAKAARLRAKARSDQTHATVWRLIGEELGIDTEARNYNLNPTTGRVTAQSAEHDALYDLLRMLGQDLDESADEGEEDEDEEATGVEEIHNCAACPRADECSLPAARAWRAAQAEKQVH